MSPRGDCAPGVTRAVVLARHRTPEHTESEVHVIPLPLHEDPAHPGTVNAVCGRRLCLEGIGAARPDEGLWCTDCFARHVTGYPAPPPPAGSPTGTSTRAHRLAAGMAYRTLGWPATLHRTQICLNLDLDIDAVALIIPTALATATAAILTDRCCPPPVLAHPTMPAHRVLLAGHRVPVLPDWPPGVQRITTTVLLPPSITPHGPVRWVHPPVPHALRLCRERDVIAALRTALRSAPPGTPPDRPSSGRPAPLDDGDQR